MKARALLGASLLLGACTVVGPQYRLPETALINAPAAQKPFQGAGLAAVSASEPPSAWWRLYQDEALDRLVAEALAANADLRVAAAHLARSEAVAMEAEGAGDVKAGAALSIDRARLSGESYLLEKPLPVMNLGNAGIRVGYQVDLVGGLQRAIEAAEADVAASQAALALARMSIAADVALAYAEACAAGHELDVAQRSLALQGQHQAAVSRLVAGGRRMSVDVPRAGAQVEQLRATLPGYTAQRRVALYKIAVLSGRPPGDYPREVASCAHVPQLAQPIPIGDGAALLRRRPDVRQAERLLAGATARIGVATAALYPSITLGLSAGATGILSHMGQAQTQRWGFGPLISWSLPGPEEHARVRQADAAAAAALAHFDAVVLKALQEVENALALLARDLDRHTALRTARDQAGEAARQIHTLYRAGRLPYLDELDARRGEAAAEAAVAASESQLAGDQIRVFLALGGGWD